MSPPNQPILTVDDLSVCYAGGSVVAISDLSIVVHEGEFVCLLGPTGAGKSSLINTLAGFVKPAGGTIHFQGEPVVGPSSDRGVVFQDFALFPWKTVLGNVEFGLRFQSVSPKERREQALAMLDEVGLSGWAAAYPHQLSGGMRQRVALARCFVSRPKMLLMDEPFGSLDAQTRTLMQELLLDIWQRSKSSVLFVSHDIGECIFLADRLYVVTARPAKVKDEIAVNLIRPRFMEVAMTDQFVALERRVMESIKSEVQKSMRIPEK